MTEIAAEFRTKPDPNPAPAGSRKQIWGAALGILAALPASLWLWGFTVDDALITARVATHIVQGLGPRFNPHGPAVDAVTPLGYAQLLAFFGCADVLATFRLAKALGLCAWLVAAALLGGLVAGAGKRARRFAPLGMVALSAPLAAWAVSGMETGLVTLLATLGLLGGVGGALSLGLASAWRPELVPFACALVLAISRAEAVVVSRVAWRVTLVVLPVLTVALLRKLYFGRFVPLAFYAKPSDFAHGFAYAVGAFGFTGLPWLLLATPREFRALPTRARALFVALACHWGALVLCGGDWMTMFRLVVPVLPCAALAAAYVMDQSRALASALRLGPALIGALSLAYFRGAPARGVGAERLALIARARPVFANDARIAALDVGWLGAASRAEVTDFSGVTDDESAFFPGGHTSKRIPRAWLYARRPTAIVLLLQRGEPLAAPFEESQFARIVEQRVARLVATEFRVRGTLALGDQTYVVLEPAARQ